MTECQGCGAWNDASRTLCVLCGAPLAEIDEWDPAAEPPPLPPLPDGGLGASMPAWLREPPATPAPLASSQEIALPTSDLTPLGPHADPRTFLTDDDFPQWLHDLAARRLPSERPPARTVEERPHQAPLRPIAAEPSRSAESAAVAATADPSPAPQIAPPIAADAPAPVALETAPVPAPVPVPATADRPHQERRQREPWETLLLAALLVGIAAAALWALIANGALRLGP